MHIPISKAKTHLNKLVRQAEAGEEIILTFRGQPIARVEPVGQVHSDKR